jgi:uncharacterized integral membrane protein
VFFLAFILLILLVAVALVIAVQNFAVLFSSVHLTFLSWHLPGIPILVLCLLGIFLGGLLLYVVSSISAHRDARELKKLRARVAELEEEKVQATKTPSGPLPPNFAPPVVPLPGFAPSSPPGPTGSLGQWQPPNSLQNLPPSASGNNLSMPPRQFPPLPPTGAPQPPFPHQ